MINNEKLNPVVTELFIRDRKISISIVFITQSFFKVSKDVRLNPTQFLLWKFQTKENFNKLPWIIHQILIFNQKKIIETAKFTYSSLGKAFEKQTKTIKDQGQE